LGVLRKNEQYEEDMIDILEWIHNYVPGHSDKDEQPGTLVKVLNGGDYLTHERNKSAQSAMQDGRTPSAKLLGLVSKFEDFHTQCEWLKVQYKCLPLACNSPHAHTLALYSDQTMLPICWIERLVMS
jgi:hypothetical protein